MSRLWKGILLIGIGILVIAMLAAYTLGAIPGMVFGGEEKKQVVDDSEGFKITKETPPEVDKPTPEQKEAPAAHTATQKPEPESRQQGRKGPSRGEKWYSKVEGSKPEVWRHEKADEMMMAGRGSVSGGCSISQPTPVTALMLMSATTDKPGLAMATISEDIQGQGSDGEWCIAIPAMTPVSLQVASAAEYTTNRADVTVESIWLEDGTKIDVNQQATTTDGVPGVVGEANHHVVSKTLSAGAGLVFGFVNNLSRFGQININTGEATSPFQDMLRKKLERPSEVKLSGQAVYFTLMPTSTPGY